MSPLDGRYPGWIIGALAALPGVAATVTAATVDLVDAADLHPGQTAAVTGTATAALVAHRLGAAAVTVVADGTRADRARSALDNAGLDSVRVAVDTAPVDRIITGTHRPTLVPPWWFNGLNPTGTLTARVTGPLETAILRATTAGDRLRATIDLDAHHGRDPTPPPPGTRWTKGGRVDGDLTTAIIDNPAFRIILQFTLPGLTPTVIDDRGVTLHGHYHRNHWTRITLITQAPGARIHYTGGRSMPARIRSLYRMWTRNGAPDVSDIRVLIPPTGTPSLTTGDGRNLGRAPTLHEHTRH
ncbi:hypothetical protein STSO111631_19440 [Stackebrandtia soli]